MTWGGTSFTGAKSIALFAGLSGDEFTLYKGVTNTTLLAYYQNALSITNPISGPDSWRELYNYIFVCNSVLEGLSTTTTLTPSVKQQLTGEAKFLRAFCYFYLTNLYGDVPLVTSTDYTVNAILGRITQNKVYEQIIIDLTEAQSILSEDYLDGNLRSYPGIAERTRPNKWAASALLARTYLYVGDYINAEAQATMVISHSASYRLTELNAVFLMNSEEAIWQLQPVNYGKNTEDALLFTIPSTGAKRQQPRFSQLICTQKFRNRRST